MCLYKQCKLAEDTRSSPAMSYAAVARDKSKISERLAQENVSKLESACQISQEQHSVSRVETQFTMSTPDKCFHSIIAITHKWAPPHQLVESTYTECFLLFGHCACDQFTSHQKNL